MNELRPGSLEYWARVHPDEPALIEGDRIVTWKAWNDEADRLAEGLSRLGLVAGDVLVTLGAGDVGTIADAFLRRLSSDRHD